MRPVLFAVEPLGTGKVYRCLAIARQLRLLFPAIQPHFAAGGGAAELVAADGHYPVDRSLTALIPGPRTRDPNQARRRFGSVHAREVVAAARRIQADVVVVDSIASAPVALRRAGFKVVYLTDDLFDAEPAPSLMRRLRNAWALRSIVGSTRLRFFIGEPSYLASPELRVWSRKFFRFAGPLSGLSSLLRRECAALRDDLGVGSGPLITISAGGSAYHAELFQSCLQAAAQLLEERPEWTIVAAGGPELTAEVSPHPSLRVLQATPELCRYFAVSDVAVVPGSLSSLFETSGLGIPTLCLPSRNDPVQLRHARYFHARHGVGFLPPDRQTTDEICAAIAGLVDHPGPRPNAPDTDEQRRNAEYVADFIADLMGRKRPAVA